MLKQAFLFGSAAPALKSWAADEHKASHYATCRLPPPPRHWRVGQRARYLNQPCLIVAPEGRDRMITVRMTVPVGSSATNLERKVWASLIKSEDA